MPVGTKVGKYFNVDVYNELPKRHQLQPNQNRKPIFEIGKMAATRNSCQKYCLSKFIEVGVDCDYENDFDYETREDGHVYTVIKSQKLKSNNFKRVYYNLENMLGDEKLDTAVNDLLNQYWRELSYDLFEDMQGDLFEIMKAVVNVILGVFPVDIMITDYNS